MTDRWEIVPLKQRDARAFIDQNHRHNKGPRGDIIRVGVEHYGQLVGVATAGRPIARMLDDGRTLEVTRCCALEGHRNACSQMYAALRRAAKALGWRRMFTYTLASESGASLKASGWQRDCAVKPAAGWARTGRDRATLFTDKTDKVRWVIEL